MTAIFTLLAPSILLYRLCLGDGAAYSGHVLIMDSIKLEPQPHRLETMNPSVCRVLTRRVAIDVTSTTPHLRKFGHNALCFIPQGRPFLYQKSFETTPRRL
jgi:hypothetical protein